MRSFAGMLAPVVAALALAAGAIAAAPRPVAAAINPANFTARSTWVSIEDDANGSATARCPANYKVVNGGASWLPQGVIYSEETLYLLDAFLRSSMPTADGTGWYAAGHNRSGHPLFLNVVANCLPKAALGTTVVKTREVTVDPARSGNADLTCKSTQVAISGGGAWHKPGKSAKASLAGSLTTSRPDPSFRGWTVAGRNAGSATLMLQARVVCATKSAVTGCCGRDTRLSAAQMFQQLKQNASCISGRALTGGIAWDYDTNGGLFVGYVNSDSRGHIQSSRPSDDGLGWYAASNQDDFLVPYASVETVAVCAGS